MTRYGPDGLPVSRIRSSGVHCDRCRVPFAAGYVPSNGFLVCRECRPDMEAGDPPTLPGLR